MNRIKNSRGASFAAAVLIYMIAGVVGILVFRALHYTTWLRLLLADVTATVVTFLFSLLFKNASVYDPYWSVQPPVILVGFALLRGVTAASLLPLIAVLLWGVRLTANWAYTFHGFDREDWRYRVIKNRTGGYYPLVNFFGIHLMPTLIVYLCTLPAVFLFENSPRFSFWALPFFLLSLIGLGLELVADIQMQSFRKSGRGGLIRTGLWRNSRHPNYLGEILMWWGVGLYAVSTMPNIWYLLGGALANTILFLSVSIPMADERQSLKYGYEQYYAETNMLMPFKKSK